tara:strand:+ start:254 stop:406 length:153 start_codon:yes stop_codon:yes gene_type:complete
MVLVDALFGISVALALVPDSVDPMVNRAPLTMGEEIRESQGRVMVTDVTA